MEKVLLFILLSLFGGVIWGVGMKTLEGGGDYLWYSLSFGFALTSSMVVIVQLLNNKLKRNPKNQDANNQEIERLSNLLINKPVIYISVSILVFLFLLVLYFIGTIIFDVSIHNSMAK
ncbi:MAG: hypothetical protein K6A44_07240 [bacterium]|nr:hypothetical protein [bacterium]